MKIYTSYWAMVRHFPKTLVGLNTTVWPPKWRPLGKDANGVIVIDCPPLKPGPTCEGLCNGKCLPRHPQDCEFLNAYQRQLDEIDFDKFYYSLVTLHNKICKEEQLSNIDFTFIFFETPQNICSERWAVQEWLKSHDVKIEEWHI